MSYDSGTDAYSFTHEFKKKKFLFEYRYTYLDINCKSYLDNKKNAFECYNLSMYDRYTCIKLKGYEAY